MNTFGGRKFILCFVGLVAVVVVGLARDMEAESILKAVLILSGVGAGSIALEDSAKALGKGSVSGKR